MDNDKAIEKLAQRVYEAMRFERKDQTPRWTIGGNADAQYEARGTAQAILAAIQADPLAYVKPKPLVWVMYSPEEPAARVRCVLGVYAIDWSEKGWFVTLDGNILYRELDRPEAAQAAAETHRNEMLAKEFT